MMCHTFLLRERESGGELGQIGTEAVYSRPYIVTSVAVRSPTYGATLWLLFLLALSPQMSSNLSYLDLIDICDNVQIYRLTPGELYNLKYKIDAQDKENKAGHEGEHLVPYAVQCV